MLLCSNKKIKIEINSVPYTCLAFGVCEESRNLRKYNY